MESQSRFFKDGVLTDKDAYEILSPHFQDIIRCIQTALGAAERLRQHEPDCCQPLTSRSWANIVHDHMEYEAKKVFGSTQPGIAIYTEKGFLIVDFYERIFLRLKKLQNNLKPCNVETAQQRAFDCQALFRGPVTLVTAGYCLNDLGMHKNSHIVCWSGDELLWALRLPDITTQEEYSEIAVPPVPVEPIVVVRKDAVPKIGNAS